jgi:hypothetical protein
VQPNLSVRLEPFFERELSAEPADHDSA